MAEIARPGGVPGQGAVTTVAEERRVIFASIDVTTGEPPPTASSAVILY